jgi:hypothetical protein
VVSSALARRIPNSLVGRFADRHAARLTHNEGEHIELAPRQLKDLDLAQGDEH